MIVRPPQNWLRMLFIWDGSVLRSILPQLAVMALVSAAATATHGHILNQRITLNPTPMTLCGVALTIFLAFRNNASYERYREARHLWGNLLIAARTLTSQALHYAPADPARFDRAVFVRELNAFACALKHQLRGSDPSADFARLLGEARAQALLESHYRPVELLDDMRRRLAGLQRAGGISDTQLWMFDAQLAELGTIVGGCERILSTPIPFSYGVLLHRTVYAYCLLLPFGLVDSIGIATPLISLFVSYTMIALEAIASDIADPFGFAPNNLALDAMTRTIERSTLELCGEAIPEDATPGRRYQLT
ncbi:hypothetical protein CY652_13450 [Burkholderia sp. WAC0059]|uniref:bestrophin family protein n=1 Tax=Burkholderia sp. WAC0059 TaxID=2066022 RepID=UPI000C7F0E3A|nr:bestrophin family ion channel [Burkholderia sp. WAC0059]PLZ02025.1 hypothetical protein CY652_13450 [Burkholderia sp. WAC0059]